MEYVARLDLECPKVISLLHEYSFQINNRDCGDTVLYELGGYRLKNAVHNCMIDTERVDLLNA